MFNEERHNYIIEKLKKDQRVSVTELSKELDVSEVTIRKDLNYLEDENYLKRTHGGAILNDLHVKSEPIEIKLARNMEKKRHIGKLAERFLRDDLNIFLDAGTTVQSLIPKLSELNNLNIITYDLEIAYLLAAFDNLNIYMLGGYIEHDSKTALSIEGYENLSSIHADICFIGTDAFDSNYVYSTNENKGKIKNKMIVNSSKSVLMCDSSKYDKRGLYSFYRCEDFDYFITDSDNEDLIKEFKMMLKSKLIY